MKNLLDDAYEKAVRLLRENMDKLTLVAETLLDIETLDAEQFEDLYTGAKSREEIVQEARSRADEKAEQIARQKAEAAKEYEAEKAAREREKENAVNLRFENMKAETIVFENKNENDADTDKKSGKNEKDDIGSEDLAADDESSDPEGRNDKNR